MAQTRAETETAQPEFEQIVIDFDELDADHIVGNRVGLYASDQYAGRGVRIASGVVDGLMKVGGTVRVATRIHGFEVLGGIGQHPISHPNMIVATGNRAPGALLFKFEQPVKSVSVTSDSQPNERPDAIRLLILEPTTDSSQFKVLAVVEKQDDAVKNPENLLKADLNGKLFSYVAFCVMTESEAVDDLKFDRVQPPSKDK